MATSTLTATITSNINLSGKEYGSSNSYTIEDIENTLDKQVNVTTGSTTDVLTIGSGSELEGLDYLVITNENATNYVTVGLIDTGAKAVYFRIDAGQSQVFLNSKLDANATGGAFAAFTDIDTVNAEFDTAAGIVSIFAAKKQ